MESQISVRLPDDLSRALSAFARERGVKRSRVVRDALRFYLHGAAEEEPPYDRVRELAGAAYGGPVDLGARHREHLKEILGAG